MSGKMILCPLKEGKMTLTPEVMAKLNVKAGEKLAIIKKDGLFFLCNALHLKEGLNSAEKP